MSEPEFGLSDLDILKETFDNIGVEYTVSERRSGSYLSEQPRLIGFEVCIEPHGDAEFSFLFDTDGKFTDTLLWTSW